MKEKEELSNFINKFKIHNKKELFDVLANYDIINDWEKVTRLIMNNSIDREFRALIVSIYNTSSNVKTSLNVELKDIIRKRNKAKYEENYIEVYRYSRFLYLLSNIIHYIDVNVETTAQEEAEEES